MFLQSKQDYQEKLFEVLNPLVSHYSASRARLTLGYTGASYTPTVAQIEGFARVLWGLTPYYCGGGANKEFEEIYLNCNAFGIRYATGVAYSCHPTASTRSGRSDRIAFSRTAFGHFS